MKYKFKKGSKVEVLNNREAHSGSWLCAEILSGNGHTYSVRYDPYLSEIGAAVERVPRKAIRPCPPLVKSPCSWVPGDVVEVCDNSSWKTAEVSRVAGGGYYFVRLLRSSMDFRAHVSELRLQHSWQDDTWVVIGKDAGKHIDDTINKLPKEGSASHQMVRPCMEVKKHTGDRYFPIGDGNDLKKLNRGLLGVMERRLDYTEMCSGASRKTRAIEKEGTCQRLVVEHMPRPREKVDAVSSPRKMLGGKYMHASLNNRTTKIIEMGSRKKIANLEPSDSESTSSSVGSSGTCESPYRSIHPVNGHTGDLGSHSDDADTFPGSRSESLLPTKKAVEAEIHQLELHAYRTTLVALHASGPISWEREALMTNLRLVLNISTDEHLMELRNLLPVENSAPLR